MEQLEVEIEQMMKTWKEEAYVDAWDYMQKCGDAVLEPGYLETPWGRRRRFPPCNDDEMVSAMKREAQNFP